MTTNTANQRNQAPDIAFVLDLWASENPDLPAFSLHTDRETLDARESYSELKQSSDRFAQSMIALGLDRKPVLCLLPDGVEFASVLFACVKSRNILVPVKTPGGRNPRHWELVESIILNAEIKNIVTTDKIAELIEGIRHDYEGLGECKVIRTSQLNEHTTQDIEFPARNGDDIALLQYTSGSTSAPKGVILTNRNIIEMQHQVYTSRPKAAGLVWVSWLPLHHDLGMCVLLHAVYCGMHVVKTSPVAFVQKPLSWLWLISDYKASVSGGPNFAFDMVVEALQSAEISGLDLSSWKTAYCGAEPINPNSLVAFADATSAYGFEKTSWACCYGLAEAVVGVSIDRLGETLRTEHFDRDALERMQLIPVTDGGKATTELVACGKVFENIDLQIVDPESHAASAAGDIGEIWIRGKNIASGYWRNPEATEKTFDFAMPDGTKGYCRTGDLGAFIGDHLYVTGRIKEMIIVRGRNLYPSDLENAIGSIEYPIPSHSTVAIGVKENGEERIVVLQEMKRGRKATDDDCQQIFRQISAMISEQFSVEPTDIVLVRALSLPKTTSGKFKRGQAKKLYLANELRVIARLSEQANEPTKVASPTSDWSKGGQTKAMESLLLTTLVQTTGIASTELARETPLMELGISSIKAVKFIGEVSEKTGLDLDPSLIWDYSSIQALAEYILQSKENSSSDQKGTLQNPTGPIGTDQVSDEALQDMSEADALNLLQQKLS